MPEPQRWTQASYQRPAGTATGHWAGRRNALVRLSHLHGTTPLHVFAFSMDASAAATDVEVDEQSPLVVEGIGLSSGVNVEDESVFDWASMVLGGLWEEEGRHDVPSETQMYSQLGLIEENEAEENRRDEALRGGTTNFDESDHVDSGDQNTDQPCEDYLPDEKRAKYDKINPSMQPVCFRT